MTQPPAPRARIHGLAVLALLGLSGWALLTLLVGVESAVSGVREVAYVTSPHDPGVDPEPILYPEPWLTLAFAAFVLWVLLTLTFVLPAAALGIVHIALAHGGWRRCAAFGVVAIAAPAGAAAILLTEDPYFGKTSYVEATRTGVGMTLVAVLAVPLAWRLLAARPARAAT